MFRAVFVGPQGQATPFAQLFVQVFPQQPDKDIDPATIEKIITLTTVKAQAILTNRNASRPRTATAVLVEPIDIELAWIAKLSVFK